jgi:hypothetical protein
VVLAKIVGYALLQFVAPVASRTEGNVPRPRPEIRRSGYGR